MALVEEQGYKIAEAARALGIDRKLLKASPAPTLGYITPREQQMAVAA